MRTLIDGLAIRQGGTPGSWINNATYGNWVKLATVGREALLIVTVAAVSSDLTIDVFEATDNTGSGATKLTSISGSKFTASPSQANYVAAVTVRDTDLDNDFPYVAVKPNPGASTPMAAVWAIGRLYTGPASNKNDSTDKVAFATFAGVAEDGS